MFARHQPIEAQQYRTPMSTIHEGKHLDSLPFELHVSFVIPWWIRLSSRRMLSQNSFLSEGSSSSRMPGMKSTTKGGGMQRGVIVAKQGLMVFYGIHWMCAGGKAFYALVGVPEGLMQWDIGRRVTPQSRS